jgi:proliferating cell nuclear antigen PCNA
MTIIFKAKTNEGYTIKVLSELLQNIVRIACLELTQECITMRMMDSHRHILIDIKLKNTNFNVYEIVEKETMYLGINLGHLYKMLKSVKKKDSLMLNIDNMEPEILTLVVYPKENNRISTSFIRIQSIQHINVPLPSGYNYPVIIPSGDYQRTLKDMNNIGDTLTITMKKYSLKFSCSAQGIYSREVLFGELDDNTEEYYQDEFDMEQFIRILKIAGLSKNLQIFSGGKTLPLLIVSQIGQLGDISIYIKSKEQIRIDGIMTD